MPRMPDLTGWDQQASAEDKILLILQLRATPMSEDDIQAVGLLLDEAAVNTALARLILERKIAAATGDHDKATVDGLTFSAVPA